MTKTKDGVLPRSASGVRMPPGAPVPRAGIYEQGDPRGGQTVEQAASTRTDALPWPASLGHGWTLMTECGVTMNDSVESRAIAEVTAEKPGITVTYLPGMIRIDGEGKIEFKLSEISEVGDDTSSVRDLHLHTSRPHGDGGRRNHRAIR